jgi:hypothetical protein
MGGFFSSPESNSSVTTGNTMGASVSKNTAMAPRLNAVNRNLELAKNARNNGTNEPKPSAVNNANANMASEPGTPGTNGNTRRNNNRNKNRNNNSRINKPGNNVAINVNRLQEVVVEEPPQANAGEGVVGNNQAGGRRRRHRKGSRKASRKHGHKSRRR